MKLLRHEVIQQKVDSGVFDKYRSGRRRDFYDLNERVKSVVDLKNRY